MPPRWVKFETAIAATESRRRHLLLGNGFSISKHARFQYDSLYDEAVRYRPTLRPLFEGHGSNFEAAMAAATTPDDRIEIRKGLVEAIGRVHPRRKFLEPPDCESCGKFLERFAGTVRGASRGRVFTTNYDLFLYWVLMQRQTRLKLYDGFDHEGVWRESRRETTFVHYLHGALHHYEVNIGRVKREMQQYKLLYEEEGVELVRAARQHIALGHFPVFVSEGTSEEKRLSINRNPYLRRMSKWFGLYCDDPEAAIFTVGHSFSDFDRHITDLIGSGTAPVFIGVHLPTDDGAQAVRVSLNWAEDRRRAGLAPKEVHFFDSSECPIWSA